MSQPIWEDDWTSWYFLSLPLILVESKDTNNFSEHMRWCNSYPNQASHILKQAQAQRVSSDQSKPRAGCGTVCQRQRSSRAFCKASAPGTNVYQVLTSFLSVLHLLCTHRMLELVTAQQQIMPSNTGKQKVGRQVTGTQTHWAEFLGGTGDCNMARSTKPGRQLTKKELL